MAAFHVAFPLCHFVLYPSHPSWTEEGHHGAWHTMLLDTAGTPQQAVYVVSCSSSMDARPARKLYILSANLPDYEGEVPRSVVQREAARARALRRDLDVGAGRQRPRRPIRTAGGEHGGQVSVSAGAAACPAHPLTSSVSIGPATVTCGMC